MSETLLDKTDFDLVTLASHAEHCDVKWSPKLLPDESRYLIDISLPTTVVCQLFFLFLHCI